MIYQVALEPSEGGGGGSDFPPSVITFNRNLNLGGSITVNAPDDESFEINVKGQLTTGGNSINGVDTITATDSIQIGSGSTYKILRSNGDVRIDGSVTIATSVMALGNICFTGGTSLPGLAKANGFVYGTGSAAFGAIEARAQSTYFGANPRCDTYYLNDSYGVPFGVNLAGNNAAGTVKTSGGVRHHSGIIQALQAQKDLHITNGGGRVVSGTIGGLKKYCTSSPTNCQATFPAWKEADVNVNSSSGYTVSLTELEEVEIEVPVFDAYLYESNANYAFRVNGAGYKVVTVRNVRNINNGEYYLGNYSVGGAHGLPVYFPYGRFHRRQSRLPGASGESTRDNLLRLLRL